MRTVSIPATNVALVSVLAFGSLIGSNVFADAATVHRPRPRPHVSVDTGRDVAAPRVPSGTARVAVPGWSEEDTRRWLDNASSMPGGG